MVLLNDHVVVASTPAGPVAVLKQRVTTAGLDEVTATFWYKPDANQLPVITPLDINGLTLITDKADEWTLRVGAKVEAGKMYWFPSGKSPAWRTPGDWQFIAVTWKRNPSEVVWYQATKTQEVKEARRKTSNLTPEAGLMARNGNWPDVIGNTANSKSYDRAFSGSIDNVRIFGKALDVPAIEAVRQADLKNAAPSL